MGWKKILTEDHEAAADPHPNYVLNTLTLTGGSGIATIGDLSTNRTIQLDFAELAEETTPASTDLLCIYNGTIFEKVQWSNLPSGSIPTLADLTDTDAATVGTPNDGDHLVYRSSPSPFWYAEAHSGASMTSSTINQSTHGFSVGNAVYYQNSTSKWQKADADSAGSITDAIVATVPDTNNFTLCYGGEMTWTSHGLTQGDVYYLSATAGAITSTKPSTSGQYVQAVVKPIGTNTVLVNIGSAYEVP